MEETFETGQLIWRLHGKAAESYSQERLEKIEPAALFHLKAARIAAEAAYAPYSKFRVGASVLGKMGEKIGEFTGCNVENASYGATMCAERVAIFSGVAQGFKKFELMALSTLDSASEANLSHRSPCGLCRQVMSEFFDDTTIIVIDGGNDGPTGKHRVDFTTIDPLLPWRFSL